MSRTWVFQQVDCYKHQNRSIDIIQQGNLLLPSLPGEDSFLSWLMLKDQTFINHSFRLVVFQKRKGAKNADTNQSKKVSVKNIFIFSQPVSVVAGPLAPSCAEGNDGEYNGYSADTMHQISYIYVRYLMTNGPMDKKHIGTSRDINCIDTV